MAVKLLFFTFYYPPLGSARSIQISRMVKYSRHDISVVSGKGSARRDTTISDGQDTTQEHLRVDWDQRLSKKWFSRWNPLPRDFGEHLNSRIVSALKRFQIPPPDPYRPWANKAARLALDRFNFSELDALVTLGQPMSVHLGGLTLARETSLPWLAHFSDPWTKNPYNSSLPLIKWLNQRLEATVFTEADRLAFTNQYALDFSLGQYDREIQEKGTVTPHSYDPDRFPESPDNNEHFVIRHVGHLYGRRTPAPLIEALNEISRSVPALLQNVTVEFVGGMSPRIDLPDFEFPKHILKVRDPVPYEESLRLMSTSDLLVVIDANLQKNIFFPSKLADYLGSGRDILAITPEGPTEDILKETGGTSIRHQNVRRLADVLRDKITSSSKKSEPSMKSRQRFAARNVVNHFDEIMKNIDETG